MRIILYFYQLLNCFTSLSYRSKIFKLKVVQPREGMLKVFGRGLKLVKYCKTCKSYIADSEIIRQCFSSLFFCDPKLLKTTICKDDSDPNRFDEAQ